MPDATHECPAPGCERRVPRHQFACPRDWGRLPADLRRAIVGNYRRDWAAHAAAMTDAMQWYQEATNA